MIMYITMTAISILSTIFVAPKYPHSYLLIPISAIISIIELSVYLLTALKNPGIIVPPKIQPESESMFTCSRCKATKVKGSFHCVDCDVCIRGWDHHCVWTGKCIGEGNMNNFWFFLAWTLVFLSYHLGTTLGVYKDLGN